MIRLLLVLVTLAVVYLALIRPGETESGQDAGGLPKYESRMDAARDVEVQMQQSLDERMRGVAGEGG